MDISFKPYQCTNSELNATAINNGAMYVITDTKQLAFDINGERIIISAVSDNISYWDKYSYSGSYYTQNFYYSISTYSYEDVFGDYYTVKTANTSDMNFNAFNGRFYATKTSTIYGNNLVGKWVYVSTSGSTMVAKVTKLIRSEYWEDDDTGESGADYIYSTTRYEPTKKSLSSSVKICEYGNKIQKSTVTKSPLGEYPDLDLGFTYSHTFVDGWNNRTFIVMYNATTGQQYYYIKQ